MATKTKHAAFLIKSEPSTYAWSKLVDEGGTRWDGIRNYEARNNLRAMKKGDYLLFYHSGEGKEIVGVARVTKEAYADPTATEGDWSAVDIAPGFPLAKPVTLTMLREEETLAGNHVVAKPRISCVGFTPELFAAVLKLAKTKLPKD